MRIIDPELFFETEKDENGRLMGLFYGKNFASSPVYSKETALNVLKVLGSEMNFRPEDRKGAEVCIQNSELPDSSPWWEEQEIRMQNIENQIEIMFDMITTGDNGSIDPLDQELQNNLIRGGEPPSGYNVH